MCDKNKGCQDTSDPHIALKQYEMAIAAANAHDERKLSIDRMFTFTVSTVILLMGSMIALVEEETLKATIIQLGSFVIILICLAWLSHSRHSYNRSLIKHYVIRHMESSLGNTLPHQPFKNEYLLWKSAHPSFLRNKNKRWVNVTTIFPYVIGVVSLFVVGSLYLLFEPSCQPQELECYRIQTVALTLYGTAWVLFIVSTLIHVIKQNKVQRFLEEGPNPALLSS